MSEAINQVNYAELHCQPAEAGGVASIARKDVLEAMPALGGGWSLKSHEFRLRRTLVFSDFKALMRFVNAMAELAEAEAHHPDFWVHYNRLEITLWTHAIGGISENDLIMAAKISALCARGPAKSEADNENKEEA